MIGARFLRQCLGRRDSDFFRGRFLCRLLFDRLIERRGPIVAELRRLIASFDDGASWRRLGGNLPVVPIHDMVVVQGDLVLATHGRSFWVLDDITPLRQLSDELLAEPAPTP